MFGNPTHDKSIIQFKNESQSKADLKIYSATGVLVEHLKSNQSSFIIDRKNLANGIYIYSVTLDGKAASGKLIFN
ncbi:MAG: T9SS type A sorting domain-containing protein [Chitinophagales bacterium]